MIKLTIATINEPTYVNPALIRCLHTPANSTHTCITFDSNHRIIVTESMDDVQRAVFYDTPSWKDTQ